MKQEEDWRELQRGVFCGNKEALVAPQWPVFLFFFFTVSSKSPVPEGAFESTDLPLFSGFVPTAHAAGWNLRGARLVGESGFFSPYLCHVEESFAFLKHGSSP